jgi:cyanophycinase
MIVTGREGMKIRRGMVDLAPGLGLISHAIVDQHFSQRGRLGSKMAEVLGR